MTIKELATVSPQCFIFIREEDGRVHEYKWGDEATGAWEVTDIIATDYPMYKKVLEVKAIPHIKLNGHNFVY